jgi:hypothetical protein
VKPYLTRQSSLITSSTSLHISSRNLSNEELDVVLAAFRAISQPDSLNAQLRAPKPTAPALGFTASSAPAHPNIAKPLLRTNSAPPISTDSA